MKPYLNRICQLALQISDLSDHTSVSQCLRIHHVYVCLSYWFCFFGDPLVRQRPSKALLWKMLLVFCHLPHGFETYKWLVAQSCPTLCSPLDCGLPGSSVHRILQTRTLEWTAITFSSGSSRPRDRTQISCIAGKFFTIWATRKILETYSWH